MDLILSAVLVLGAIALVAALVLFGVSKKFAVEEDPRLGQVGEFLPGANCGGCGFAGCSGMAAALVKGADAGSIDGLMCPVGGADVMGKVADLLGLAVANTEAKVAVVRCNGSCEHRPRIAEYDGLHTCAAMNSCGAGETGCGFGCLGCGDCVAACQFGAIFMATDYVTSPMTHKGMLIYGVCIGLLTVIIRNWGSYPEGMSFAILIMNAFTPLINTYVKPKRFGEKPAKK